MGSLGKTKGAGLWKGEAVKWDMGKTGGGRSEKWLSGSKIGREVGLCGRFNKYMLSNILVEAINSMLVKTAP